VKYSKMWFAWRKRRHGGFSIDNDFAFNSKKSFLRPIGVGYSNSSWARIVGRGSFHQMVVRRSARETNLN